MQRATAWLILKPGACSSRVQWPLPPGPGPVHAKVDNYSTTSYWGGWCRGIVAPVERLILFIEWLEEKPSKFSQKDPGIEVQVLALSTPSVLREIHKRNEVQRNESGQRTHHYHDDY